MISDRLFVYMGLGSSFILHKIFPHSLNLFIRVASNSQTKQTMKAGIKISYVFAIAISVLMISCDGNRFDFTSNDGENVQNEAIADSYVDDADDMSAVVLSADDATVNGRESSTGRMITVKIVDPAKRFDCATITIETPSDNTAEIPKGTITIDFGTGCTDAKGNVRKGIIHVKYVGRRFLPGSTVETTFDGYSIN